MALFYYWNSAVIFGLYYHITHHDEHTGNTFKSVQTISMSQDIDYSNVSVLLARFLAGLASVFLIMVVGLHGIFNFVRSLSSVVVEMTTEADLFVHNGFLLFCYLLPAVKTIELIVF